MSNLTVKSIISLKTEQNKILARGWVKTKREAKACSFLQINDGSCLKNLQIVCDNTLENYKELMNRATLGASIEIEGKLIRSQGQEQDFEIHASSIKIIGECDSTTFPIQKKQTSDEFLRTIAHLRPRTNKYAAMLRVRSELAHAVHSFFRKNGFVYVHTPIITSSDCEGAGQMFQVTTMDLNSLPKTEQNNIDYSKDFFSKKTNLTVSGQLEGELLALALGKIYTFGPTFRAENSNTKRHCSEFWQIEPEMAFFDLNDTMDLAEKFIKFIIQQVLENCPEDIQLFAKYVDTNLMATLDNILNNDFVKVSYNEAVDILIESNEKFEEKVFWGIDFKAEHEKFLVEKHFKKPIHLYNYPKEIKSFYMRLNDDNKTVRGMDLLVPRIGEIIGCSQREERLHVLEGRMIELGMTMKDYEWYLDSRRFGTVPHSGFGLGFERAMMLVTGIDNIRDVTAFPRVPGNADF